MSLIYHDRHFELIEKIFPILKRLVGHGPAWEIFFRATWRICDDALLNETLTQWINRWLNNPKWQKENPLVTFHGEPLKGPTYGIGALINYDAHVNNPQNAPLGGMPKIPLWCDREYQMFGEIQNHVIKKGQTNIAGFGDYLLGVIIPDELFDKYQFMIETGVRKFELTKEQSIKLNITKVEDEEFCLPFENTTTIEKTMYFCDVSPLTLGIIVHFIYALGEHKDTIPDIEVQMVYTFINIPLHDARLIFGFQKLNKYLIHTIFATQNIDKFSDDQLELGAEYQSEAKEIIKCIRD